MSKACSLENSSVNLNVIREDSRRELLALIDGVKSKDICLVLDQTLAGPLNHILVDGTVVFKQYGVKDFKELSKKELGTTCTSIVFFARPVIKSMRIIAAHMKELYGMKAGDKTPSAAAIKNGPRFYLNFVSKQTLVCEEVLKREGVLGALTIQEYQLDLIPFDDDILTMEIDNCFRQFYLDNDKTHLHTISDSIIKLQNIYGLIPNVKFKGNMSKVIYQMIMRYRKEQESEGNSLSVLDPEIDTIILLDRTVDLVSVMCTPLTYEGLIDELLGISNGYVKVDSDLIADEDETPDEEVDRSEKKKIPIPLNSNDKLYADIRDMNVEQIGFYLQEQAKDIRERYDEFRKNKDASIGEIREFVKRIPGLKQNYQSLQQHINIAELIKKNTDSKAFRDLWMTERTMIEGDTMYDRLEEMMGDQESLMKILRLFCLQSLTNGGIKAKSFDNLRRLLLQTYGYELLMTVNNFEKVGLVKRRETFFADSSSFSGVRKSLRLVNDSVNVRDPGDIAYVTSGYAPVSVRIVEHAMKPGGWSSIQDAMRQLPGPTAEISQVKKTEDDVVSHVDRIDGYGEGDRKVMLVYFLGGVTFMEIAALRYLSRQQECTLLIL